MLAEVKMKIQTNRSKGIFSGALGIVEKNHFLVENLWCPVSYNTVYDFGCYSGFKSFRPYKKNEIS